MSSRRSGIRRSPRRTNLGDSLLLLEHYRRIRVVRVDPPYDLVLDGESYSRRQKPTPDSPPAPGAPEEEKTHSTTPTQHAGWIRTGETLVRSYNMARHFDGRVLTIVLLALLAGCGSGSSDGHHGSARCGNGHVELGEQCDGDDLAGRSCASFKLDPRGDLRCAPDCTFDTSKCGGSLCGNGIIDTVSGPNRVCEECDPPAFGGRSCAGFGGTGSLICGDDCRVDRASCDGLCGNGRLEPGEPCDADPITLRPILPEGVTCESLNLGAGQLGCVITGGGMDTPFGAVDVDECVLDIAHCEFPNVRPETCGNGMMEGGEDCDGSDFGTLTCEKLGLTGVLRCGADCLFDYSECSLPPGPPVCGDGIIQQGEECEGSRYVPVPRDDESGLFECELDGRSLGLDLCKNCLIDRALCPGAVVATGCGNGVGGDGEQCDHDDLHGLTCEDLGGTGTLRCDDSCNLDLTGCDNVVGNGRREGSEVCDAAIFMFPELVDVGGASCESLGYGGGRLGCLPQPRSLRRPPLGNDPVLLPRFFTSGCERHGICGDGTAADFEQCDGNDFSGATCATFDAVGELHCTDDCRFDLSECRSTAVCGDGRISYGEECEPGKIRASCTADGGVGSYTCDPTSCLLDTTGCVFSCT